MPIFLWAKWNGKILISKPNQYETHVDWFSHIGLPTTGKLFGFNCLRGDIQADTNFSGTGNYSARCTETAGFAPNDVVREFVRKYPKYKSYHANPSRFRVKKIRYRLVRL